MAKPQKHQKLELTWIGKGDEPRLEPRILIEQPEYSYGDPNTGNMLIHGDNLLALKALEQDYSGKIKCIFIDPPYNTGNAFEHYDDGIEHSLWLRLMKPRIELLRRLLSDDGSIWITLDDNEVHYFKVMCDEIFGRPNFVATFAWEKDKGRRNDTDISSAFDHVLLYAKNRDRWRKIRNPLPRTEAQEARYRNPDNDPRGPWLQGDNGTAKSGTESARFPITLPSGRTVVPPKGNYWRFSRENFEQARAEKRVYFGAKGDGLPIIKRYLSEVKDGVTPRTWWPAEEAGTNQSAKRDHLRKLLPEIEPFATPKPEELLKLVLHIGSNVGDLVLDSFLGSGTTAAVAQKMGRRWIGVELGTHAISHCLPRLKKVVDGEDQGGISDEIGWKGGGGFKFYSLAPSLLNQDKYGNWIITKEYKPDMLAAAMAKQEGFKYNPVPHQYWKQGQSSEQDFIYTTTQFITVEALDAIAGELQPGETLLICCKSFQPECKRRHPSITIKKIPQMLLGRCEYGRDDYSLNIVNMPTEEQSNSPEDADSRSVQELSDAPRKKTVKGKKKEENQQQLF